jgi:hypothetical protein
MAAAEAEVTDIHPLVEQPAPAEPAQGTAVYDSTVQQRVPTTLVFDGEEFDVTLVLNPVDDGSLVRYAKACADASAETDFDGDATAARVCASVAAAGALFDAVAADLEGVGEEGEERPENWRDFFSAQEKAAIIDETLFGQRYVEPRRAGKGKRPRWGADVRNMTTRVLFPFEGTTVETSHTLRKADAKVYSEYVAIMSQMGSVRGSDAHLLEFARWYDEHHVAHEGYKGEVPRHHRAAVFVLHMTRQRSAVRKN